MLGGPRTLAGGLLVIGALHCPSGPLEAQVAAPEIRAVEFEGNATFPSDSLAGAIATRKTECRSWVLTLFCWFDLGFALRRSELREPEVPRDIARLQIWYRGRGFREVDVEAATLLEADGRAVVRFSIEEGRPVLADSVSFEGADEFVEGGLLDDLPIGRGDRWSTLALDATRETLIGRLRNRGYPYADVLLRWVFPRDDPYNARVTFQVEAGTPARYGEIRVQGIRNLSESTVLRTLPFRSGDPYRVDQLRQAQTRLFGLDIISSATVIPDLAAEPDSLVPLDIVVVEGDPYRVRSGAGWTTAECFNVEARWTSRNFRGGGRVLQVRGRLSNLLVPQFQDLLCPQSGEGEFRRLTWVAAVDFAQPWIFSTRNSFNASVFAERQSVPDIFIREAVGLQLALVRAIGPQTPLTLSYRPELSQLDAAEILLCTGFLVCTTEDIRNLTSAKRLAPVGLNLNRDLANSLLNPTRGYRLIVDLEHASGWTGSQFRYNRVVVEGRWYKGLIGSSVLATRLRGGWVGSGGFDAPGGSSGADDIVHPQKRFYAGGANSVRGFAQSRLGPTVLALEDPTSLLSSPDQGGADCMPEELIDRSCDAGPLSDGAFISRPTGGTRVLEGNVEVRFPLGRSFEGVTFTDFGQVWDAGQTISFDDLEFTPGVGVRFRSPVGPIRVDVGYKFRRGEQLSVVTSQIRDFDPGVGDVPADRLTVDGVEIPYVLADELVVLSPTVFFGAGSRFTFHLSIGQAF